MNNLEHLTLPNLQWIKFNAFPIMGTGITPEKLSTLLRAQSLILNKPTPEIDCWSCSARAYAQVANSVLDQHKQAVLDKIAELESVEFSQTLNVGTSGGEEYYYVTNPSEIITEAVIEQSFDGKTLSVKTKKAPGRPKKDGK